MLDGLVQRIARWLMRFSKRRSRKNLQAWLNAAIHEYAVNRNGLCINIGAGGDIADWLEQAGLRAMSIDIDPKRHPDFLADVQDLSAFADASVDSVICIEVLEHVKHPHLASQELYRVMQPGGVLIGSTPFLLGIHDAPEDYFRYTIHGLKMLFADFELLQLRARNSYFEALAVLVLRLFVTGSQREIMKAMLLIPILITAIYALELIGRVLPRTDGTTGYFFVFKKPEGLSSLPNQ